MVAGQAASSLKPKLKPGVTLSPAQMEQLIAEAMAEAKRRIAERKRHTLRGACKELQECDVPEVVISGPAGTGKALAVDTLVPVPHGWQTMGELKVGDWVYGRDGEATEIVWVSGMLEQRKCYDVVFSDGTVITADAEHQWVVRTPKERDTRVRERVEGRKTIVGRVLKFSVLRTTEEMQADFRRGQRLTYSVDTCQAVKGQAPMLPVHPYVLGYWLGDGNSGSGHITTGDEEIVEHIRSLGYTVNAINSAKMHYNVVGLTKRTRLLGLKNHKRVPTAYLRASIEERLQLLQGWMDADGYIDPRSRRCELTTISKELAQAARELISSLGIKVTVRTKRATLYGKDCGIAYRIGFTTNLPVFWLPRKRQLLPLKLRLTQHRRYVTDVKEHESVPVCCIQVAADDGVFLVSESFIPTHNSFACLKKLHWLAGRYPKSRHLVVRKTRSSLSHSGLVTYERDVLGLDNPMVVNGPQRMWRMTYKYANGSEIVVGGLDKPGKVLSAEYDTIYVQQAEEVDENNWEVLTTRLRNGVVPFQQIIACCNPDRPRHWLKLRCDVGRARMLESRHEDNPILWDEVGGKWTPLGVEYIGKLDNLTGHRKLRLRYGRWIQAEGVVYDGWDPAVHLIERFDIPADWRRFRVVDFGFSNPFVCYDDQTEILTETGWVLFSELPREVPVSTINPLTKELEFQMPLAYITQWYEGPMIKGTRKRQGGADFCVTPNHRMILETKVARRWSWHKADSMPRWSAIPVGWKPIRQEEDGAVEFQVPHTQPRRGRRGKLSPVQRLDFARFLGLWLADGSLLKAGGYYTRISQKDFKETVRAILERLGWHYSEREDANGVTDFRISSRDLYEWLLENAEWQPYQLKRIPQEILQWGCDSLEALLDGLLLGDGRKSRAGSRVFYSGCGLLADDVQHLCSLLGIPSAIYTRISKGFGKEALIYEVHLQKHRRTFIKSLNISTIPYRGNVYCVEVPNGILVVRRRGRPMVCGNCQWWAVDGDERMYMYREIYHTQRTVRVHAGTIKEESRGEYIETTVCDHDAEDAATLEENDIYTEMAEKAVSVGIQKVQERLKKADDGKPRLFILKDSLVERDERLADAKKPTCTAEEFDGYVWDEKRGQKKEKPLKTDDHGMDCVRYATMYVDSFAGGSVGSVSIPLN